MINLAGMAVMKRCSLCLLCCVLMTSSAWADSEMPLEYRQAERDLYSPDASVRDAAFVRLEELLKTDLTPEQRTRTLILLSIYHRTDERILQSHRFLRQALAVAPEHLRDPFESPLESYMRRSYEEVIPYCMNILMWVMLGILLCLLLSSIDYKALTKRHFLWVLGAAAVYLLLSVGSMCVIDFLGVPAHPEEMPNESNYYCFVLLRGTQNPVFWKFLAWSSGLLFLTSLSVVGSRRAKRLLWPRLAHVTTILLLCAIVVLGCIDKQHGIDFQSYLAPLYKGIAGPAVVCAGLAALLFLPTVIAILISRRWQLRTCVISWGYFLVFCSMGLLYQHVRKGVSHSNTRAIYMSTDISEYILKYPDQFVNPNIGNADEEEFARELEEKCPIVPPETFQKQRTDDVCP